MGEFTRSVRAGGVRRPGESTALVARSGRLDLLRDLASRLGNHVFTAAVAGRGRPADPSVRARVEKHTGVGLADVRVHDGAAAGAAAALSGARAISFGHHVVLGRGEPSENSADGRRLLAHELTHVSHRRRATGVRPGWSVPGDAHERHADQVAAAATGATTVEPPGPAPINPAPAAARQPRNGPTATDDDVMVSLGQFRDTDPAAFVTWLGRYEGRVYPLLSRYGFHGSWVKPEAYLADFDHAYAKWLPSHWSRLPPIQMMPQIDPEELKRRQALDEQLVMGELPDGTVYNTTRKNYRLMKQQMYARRALQTLSNIEGGIGGAIGYGLAGDEGSDVGAAMDGLMTAGGQTLQGRQTMRDVGASLGPSRPVAAEVRSADPREPIEPLSGENATIPVVRPATAPPPTPAAAPASTPAAVPPAPKSATTATPPAAAAPKPPVPQAPLAVPPTTLTPNAGWRRDWDPLVEQASRPTPRQNDRGFRSQEAASADGRTRVIVTEGVIGDQVGGKSTADFGERRPGEHSTHPVGRQLGEDVGPSAQASGPATFNLSEMKVIENGLRAAADISGQQGATVETRTIMVAETQTVNGRSVPVLVGVRREAWLRMPGSDTLTLILDYRATIDAQTRTVSPLKAPRTPLKP